MENEDTFFRDTIKYILKKHKISQNMLAKEADKSSGSISQIISAKGEIRIETKTSIIKGLKKIFEDRNIALTPNDEKEAKFFGLINQPISIFSFTNPIRENFNNLIDQKIIKAKKEIVFVASISETRLNKEWVSLFANKLIEEKEINIYLFFESLQNLYWRSLSLDCRVQSNNRSYEDLKNRFHLGLDHFRMTIFNFIRAGTKGNESEFETTISRLIIREVDIPLYNSLTKIDNEIIITMRNHLRGSLAYTEIVSDMEHVKWKQADEYISFLKECSADEKPLFVSPLGAEKIKVYTDNGKTCRGEICRETFKIKPDLETRVAHGLIFNRKGELLIRYRTGEFDNNEMWDKSFGGNFKANKDFSFRDTAKRELKEEIFVDLITRLRKKLLSANFAIDFQEPIPVDCGDWRGIKGVEPYKNENTWLMFLMSQSASIPSLRLFDKPRKEILRRIYADTYIYICNNDFLEYINTSLKKSSNDKICKWVNVHSFKLSNQNTTDLNTYLQDPHIGKLIEIESVISSIWRSDNK